MATLVLRTVKGTPLTNSEVDGNFSNLNSESGVVFNRANTINSNVGVLSNLTTSEKSNIVAAINEIASESTTNVGITGGTISGVVVSNSTWNGNSIAIAYTDAKLATVSNTSPIGASVSGSALTLTHLNSGASAGTYGGSTAVPVITVDARGHVTDVSNTAISTGTVTSVGITAGTGISVSGSPITSSGNITVTNSGVTSLAGTSNQITVTGPTGAVTLSTPQSIGTASSVQFGSFGVGTAASGTTGEIRATNNITAYYSSDRRLKENIQPIPDALNVVNSIGGKLFDWTDEYINNSGGEDPYFIRKQDFGVIAQDVQQVFPRAVHERENGILAVDYEKLVALAFAAIGELTARIKELENK